MLGYCCSLLIKRKIGSRAERLKAKITAILGHYNNLLDGFFFETNQMRVAGIWQDADIK